MPARGRTSRTKLTLGWIGAGRMGFEMAARLAKGGMPSAHSSTRA